MAAVSAPEASEPPPARKEGLAASPSRKMAAAAAGGVIPAAAAPLFPTDLSAAAAAAAFAAGMCPLPPVFSPISAAPGQPPALAANPAAVQMQVPAAAAAGTMTGLELHSHERRANRTRFTNHQIQVPPYVNTYYYCYWLGNRVVSVLGSGAEGPGFKSQSRRCRVITVLGKLFTPIVHLFTKQQNW